MDSLEDLLTLESVKAQHGSALEDQRNKFARELESVRSLAAQELEALKLEHAKELEKIKQDGSKQEEILKISLLDGIERQKTEGNRDIEILKLKKQIWDKTIETQMHFNEMCVKSRQLGLSFVVAALGLAVVLLGKDSGVMMSIPLSCELFGCAPHKTFTTHVAGLVVLVAAAGLYGVRRLDLDVYHRMLRGAVAFGEDLERQTIRIPLMNTPMGMTELVSLYSRNETVRRLENGKGYEATKVVTARDKIGRFYNIGITSLVAIGFFLLYTFTK